MDDDVVAAGGGTRKSTRNKATTTVAVASGWSSGEDDNNSNNNIKKKKKRARQTKQIKTKTIIHDEDEDEEEEKDIEDLCFGKDEIFKLRASLLHWYDNYQRDLPWRTTTRVDNNNNEEEEDDVESDKRAYAVWVSEIMLQQTRVQTVIQYYNRWIHKWPTLVHLSQASLEEVNEMWAGLGYYRRARFLHEGAKMIVEGGGGFPKTLAEIRKVRGIGDYTAGAIASIAFGEAVPVVDGNVVRVIARLKTISANPKDSKTVKTIWKLAGQLVDPDRPGDFNQALMELGATLCTVLNPSCSTCPISSQCHALSVSTQDSSVVVTDYPTKVVKAKKRHDFSAVSVVEIIDGEVSMDGPKCDSRFLLVKRPDKGLLAGLWEFPSVLLTGDVDLVTRRDGIDQLLKSSFNLDPGSTCSVVLRKDVGEYVHVFSHIRRKMYIELLVLRLKGRKNAKVDNGNKEWKFVCSKDIASLGLTSGVRKVYTMVQKYKECKLENIPRKSVKKL